ncbi:phosphotransferase family protein [Streptomyces liangshanensis]|uniref:Aminoglycoside phosphotransferase family protein n=1 Tax=Streptomyces liangshanensis TaxID=2717324 RepID=A0A6G9H7B2_9ACTN|nr:phosphotransferase [Streptomyces liangshanensis]QIQ06334.1 aminoglycoside phosphotransferase family protein [Streptomyces liangshanensis]
MTGTTRGDVTPRDVAAVVRAAFGPGRGPVRVDRLRGGSKKGVYRLTFDDASSVVLYSWAASENYWPARAGAPDAREDPFSDATGYGLFVAAHRALTDLGVRAPRVHLADNGGELFPADFAVVEDLPGETLDDLLDRDRDAAAGVVVRLGEMLTVLHGSRSPVLGKVAVVAAGDGVAPGDRTAEQVVLDRVARDLAEGAALDPRLAELREPLAEVAEELAGAVAPRAAYGLIHGELGPDHVLIDPQGRPVLIDIEGLMHFDVEWEHVFLRIRFGASYPALHRPGLDEDRLRLYRFAQHLSLVAGPLRILQGDFPDRAFMRGLVEEHLDRVREFLTPRGAG